MLFFFPLSAIIQKYDTVGKEFKYLIQRGVGSPLWVLWLSSLCYPLSTPPWRCYSQLSHRYRLILWVVMIQSTLVLVSRHLVCMINGIFACLILSYWFRFWLTCVFVSPWVVQQIMVQCNITDVTQCSNKKRQVIFWSISQSIWWDGRDQFGDVIYFSFRRCMKAPTIESSVSD